MKAKVLEAIMKLQAAQIMCSNEGLHTNLTTHCIDHGSIGLDVYANTPEEEKTASDILCAYDFAGAIRESKGFAKGTTDGFTCYTLEAYLSKIK